MLRKLNLISLGVLFAVFCIVGSMSAQAQTKPSKITMLSGSPGGSWYPISAGISKALGDQGINVKLETGAGNSNIMNIAAGNAETAFSLTTANYRAKVGAGVFKKPIKGIVGLTVLFSQYAHTMVSVDSGVKSYPELKGKRMASQSMSAGSRAIFNDTLIAYGLQGEKDLNIITRGGPGVGGKAFRDRQVIGFVATTGTPSSVFSETSMALPTRLLPINDAAFKKLQEMNPGYSRCTIAAGVYKQIDYETPTICDKTVLIAHESMSEDAAYWIVRTFAESLKQIRKINPAVKNLTVKQMSQIEVLDIHPGAMKYYKEAGVF